MNDYSISTNYPVDYMPKTAINEKTTVNDFKRDYQFIRIEPADHPLWGRALVDAIEINNMEIVKYVVKKCSERIFELKFPKSHVPLAYVKTAEMTQLLIDLGADVNINYYSSYPGLDYYDDDELGYHTREASPLFGYLDLDLNKGVIDRKVIKCLIRNNALLSRILLAQGVTGVMLETMKYATSVRIDRQWVKNSFAQLEVAYAYEEHKLD